CIGRVIVLELKPIEAAHGAVGTGSDEEELLGAGDLEDVDRLATHKAVSGVYDERCPRVSSRYQLVIGDGTGGGRLRRKRGRAQRDKQGDESARSLKH